MPEAAESTPVVQSAPVTTELPGGTPAAELSDEDSYLDAIGMLSEEDEYDPGHIISPDEPATAAAEEPAEPAAEAETVSAAPATTAADPFMEWVSKQTPEQITAMLQATQPGAKSATEVIAAAEPEISVDELVKPLAEHFQTTMGEDATPALKAFASTMLKQVGDVFKRQVAAKDAEIKGLNDQLGRIVAHIERQEVASVLKPLAKTYPDLNKPGMRDQVEAKMRALARTDEYTNLADLARDAALLTFGGKAVAAQHEASAKKNAANRAGNPITPGGKAAVPKRASRDTMESRLAELAASGAGAKRMQAEKAVMGW